MAEQKTYSIKIDGIEQSVKGVENLGSAFGTNISSMKDLRKALKAVQDEMAGLDKNSEQWKKLAKVAGEYQDRIQDIRDATRRFASDTKALDDAINLGQSMTSVFTLAQGAMSAFGMETEDAVKSIQKLQGAMAIIQSLQTLQNTLRGSSATATLLTKAMNMLTLGIKGTSTGMKILRGVMASLGIGLVIFAVTALVEHWEDLVGWLNKTFPALNKLGGAMNVLEGVVMGVGKAVINWLVNPWKTFAEVVKKILEGDLPGALKAAQEGVKNQFVGTVDAFKDGFQKQVERGLEQITLKQVEEDNKRTKHNLEMLKAKKGNEAKYSKEGIALQKKDFEERKKLAKGNKDELDKIAVEEANFYRECQESKSAAAKKAADEAKKAAKKRAEEEKKAAEEAKKARDKSVNAEIDAQRSIKKYTIESIKYNIEAAKKNVEKYSAGPVEDYNDAVKELNESEKELHKVEEELRKYDIFTEYRDSIDNTLTSFTEFDNAIKEVDKNIATLFQNGVKMEDIDAVISGAIANVKLFSKLSKDELKTVYGFILDNDKELINNSKVTQANVSEVQKNALDKEMEGIEKTTLQYELSEDKKSEATQILVQKLNTQWNNYLEHVKQVYGQDSKEYLEAQKKKQEALGKKKRDDDNPFMDLFGEDENGAGVDWDKIGKRIEQAYDAYAAPIVEGLGDSIHMMMEFAIEEAEAALDEAEEMHDQAVDKVSESKDRLSDLNERMKESSGSQLEAYKTQMADEILLLNEREMEERRLAKEKEKREKELEKQKKRQRKLELQQQLVQAIVSGALAVVNGLATQPFLPVGIAMGALAGVMTGLQIATITKQMGKLADGGLLSGPSHSMGGIPVGNTGIEVEGGEYVVNKRSTAKYLPLLQSLNEEGARHRTAANQIGKFADGGQLNYQRISENSDTLSSQNAIASAIASINFRPVVSVVDINRGQRDLTEVRQLAGANS